ncbi:MAG: VanW family protein [Clostridia bacterium]|nr:VanW family protein [Clostridia bacterium]
MIVPKTSSLTVSAMPFYDLQPKELTLRASFYTSYPASTEERKNNIKVASKSLDNVFVDSNSEFSFNDTVGPRTVNRGYKTAKIIFGGQFVDGVGGGVCQVSTTLYNAVLLAGLLISEYHPHSLAVSYVAPSFDAMVNSGSADLKFINNTHNPIIIKSHADDASIKIEIYGEPMLEKYTS